MFKNIRNSFGKLLDRMNGQDRLDAALMSDSAPSAGSRASARVDVEAAVSAFAAQYEDVLFRVGAAARADGRTIRVTFMNPAAMGTLGPGALPDTFMGYEVCRG